MAGLTKQEILFVVNRYIGVLEGYLGDFTYPKHAEFYEELGLDIDPYSYQGTTRERFIQIVSEADPVTQAAILRGILDRYPVSSSEIRTQDRYDRIAAMVAICEGAGAVGAPELRITSDVVRRAISDAETLLRDGGPTSAVDRVHTALHGYLKAVCDAEGIAYPPDASILGLFKLLRTNHPRLRDLGAHSTPVLQVLRSLGAVMDALNPARNRGSVAHPNDELLDPDEAMLFINAARTVLQYLAAKLE
jgi:Abortive infection C-terminus/HEPN domain